VEQDEGETTSFLLLEQQRLLKRNFIQKKKLQETIINVDLDHAEKAYRRFLHEWGTHWTRNVVMGGEIEVTTMVKKNKNENKNVDGVFIINSFFSFPYFCF